MLSERELEQAASQLQKFRVQSEQHSKTHTDILKKYDTLMTDYKRLLSDFEEARESREKYKQLARGSERSPFVLLLVDGDGYLFNDDLVRDGKADGGSRAAMLLNDYVKNSLRSLGLDHCKVMVRVYMNLAGLSKAMSGAKVPGVGPEKRSLAPFVANFNRSNDLFDIVDAGEMKENADFKIRAMFRQFVENSQCKHIFFAACHDVGYVSELTPYRSSRDRMTLVQGNGFHPEFTKLGFRSESFPQVFRSTPLSFSNNPIFSNAPIERNVDTKTPAVQHNSTASVEGQVCFFFQKGICKYGKACKNIHGGQDSSESAGAGSWRQTASPSKTTAPFQTNNLTKSDNDFMSGHQNGNDQSQVDFSKLLPKEDSIPPSRIPINTNQERLDYYVPPPSPESRAQFKAQIAKAKLCNSFHINGFCNNPDCQYDHGSITEGMRNCLRQTSQNQPCLKRGACRSKTCTSGHVCQKTECKFRGGKIFCKFPGPMHAMDLRPAEFVTLEDASSGENDSARLSPTLSMSEVDEDRPGVPLYNGYDSEGSVD